MKEQESFFGTHLEAGGCEARIALGQNTFHAQEEGLLDLDRVRAAIVSIGRRMLHAVRAADGRVRLRELRERERQLDWLLFRLLWKTLDLPDADACAGAATKWHSFHPDRNYEYTRIWNCPSARPERKRERERIMNANCCQVAASAN